MKLASWLGFRGVAGFQERGKEKGRRREGRGEEGRGRGKAGKGREKDGENQKRQEAEGSPGREEKKGFHAVTTAWVFLCGHCPAGLPSSSQEKGHHLGHLGGLPTCVSWWLLQRTIEMILRLWDPNTRCCGRHQACLTSACAALPPPTRC